MMDDIFTVMWKERKGLFRHRGSRTRALLTLLSPLFLAIYVPWDAGLHWLEGFPSLLISVVVPIVLVGITIPDSFAGERERHTLSTLLASRLPDRAILFGKICVAVGYACGVTLLVLLVGMLVANAAHWQGRVLLYRPIVFLVDLVMAILLSLLVSSVGILISLRSATTQEAAQTLMAIFLVPPMFLTVPLIMFRDQTRRILAALDFMQALYIALGVLLLLALGFLVVAMRRFRRSRLLD